MMGHRQGEQAALFYEFSAQNLRKMAKLIPMPVTGPA